MLTALEQGTGYSSPICPPRARVCVRVSVERIRICA